MRNLYIVFTSINSTQSIMKRYILICLLSTVDVGCNFNNDKSELTTIEFNVIAKGNLYGNGHEGILEQYLVISDQNAWDDLISQMNSVNPISDNFSEININFSDYKVIAVFEDIKPNGGYSLDLTIRSNSKTIFVSPTLSSPDRNATTVITQPFIIVKIPNSELPIVFE